ncbi:O-antigen ligase family protein [Tellurirhabdus bombi]|uniref:O-antigen ligase family protein n=1 Tax=Tellurirhabdus bombi TaxID=2907205 RepID=UPI001F25FB13|nr:O-antigen ligase family protein [Tellurirhabdus bombi]
MASLSYRFQNSFWLYSIWGVLAAIGAGYLVGTLEFVGSALVVIVPVAILLVVGVLMEPRFGLLLYLQMSFLVNFLARFLPVSAPFGLMVDAILVLVLFSIFVNGKKMQWNRLRNPAVYLVGIWFLYNILELFNPEAPYKPAWFFHVRTFSVQWFLVAIILLVVPVTKKDIRVLINSWLIWSFCGALWGFKQQYIGLTTAENIWLNTAGATTHLIFGHLRSFSFYSDAAQFGGEMSGLALVCLIWTFEKKDWYQKAFFAFLTLVFFWGYVVSGTRSALFVLLAGFPFYLLLKRDFVKLALGFCLATPLLLILLYTNAGSGNYDVQRMRSALRPMEDPSFLLRLQNQQKLSAHLKDLPFGAGIGTAADAGNRFSPEHFAAQIPPDSWYVELWIETGVVGLTLYICMLIGLIGIGVYHVWRLKDPWTTYVMYALLAEFFGMAVMAYSNPVLGQFPTSSIIFINSILLASCYRWDHPGDELATKPVANS